MMTNNELAQVFDTVLSSPGMNEAVRIDMRISRKAVLLLLQIMEAGLTGKEIQEGIPISGFLSAETQEELKTLGSDFLQKAGLVEMSEKLRQLNGLHKK